MDAPETEKTGLTLEDVALIVDGLADVPRELAIRLSRLLRKDPRFAAPIEELQSMAQDAGIKLGEGGMLTTAHELHRDFDRLLEADGWENPGEVLDADAGIDYPRLLQIASARASSTSEPAEILAVTEKLRRAYDVVRAEDELIGAFIEGLMAQEPKRASELLTRAGTEYRLRRKQSSATTRDNHL